MFFHKKKNWNERIVCFCHNLLSVCFHLGCLPSLKLTAFSPLKKGRSWILFGKLRLFSGAKMLLVLGMLELKMVNHKIHRNLRLPNAATFPEALREYEGKKWWFRNQSLHKGAFILFILVEKTWHCGRGTLRIPMNELPEQLRERDLWGGQTCPPQSSGYRICKAKNKGTWHGPQLADLWGNVPCVGPWNEASELVYTWK